MKVQFHSVDEIKGFVSDMDTVPCDVNIKDGRIILDAKSFLSLASLDLSKHFDVHPVTRDWTKIDQFYEKVWRYRA